MLLSVVICTHQPRRAFLERTIEALRAQDCPLSSWELLLIDNASPSPVAPQFELGWHPAARHLREDELGATNARIRGMREARSDLILFVDDDNVLAPDYLSQGLAIAAARPDLGVWGGQLLPEFEQAPPEWTRRWWSYLPVRPLEHDVTARHARDFDAIPPVAGEFIRRPVWEAYLEVVARDPRHLLLAPRGAQRIYGQDTDLARCTLEHGLGVARFASLALRHLIPPARLREEALLRLVENVSCSSVIVAGLDSRAPRPDLLQPWSYFLRCVSSWRLPERARKFFLAELRGRRRGAVELARLGALA